MELNTDAEEKGRAYLQRFTTRKSRYDHFLRYGTTEKYRKPFYHKMEKLIRMGKLKDMEEMEHGRHSERMKYLRMHKGYHHQSDYLAMLLEERAREGGDSDEASSDEEEIKQQTEERFKVLEEKCFKWHTEMDKIQYSSVFQTKDIVSNYILLGNDYSTERIIAMTDYLKEPVFLSKMCHLAVRWKQPSTLKVLIKYGAWVNVRISSDKKMRTPLHASCALADFPCVEVLLFSRADPDLRDKSGNTAVLLAMHAGCDEATMKLLLYHSKAKLTDHVNEEGAGLLHRCGPFMEERKGSGGDSTKPLPRRDNDVTYQLVLEKAKTSGELAAMIGLVDKASNTPLHDAIRVHSIKNLQLLLNYGADPDLRDKSGNTAVLLAMHAGCDEATMKLLLYHSKAKLTDHVNEEGAGLLHRCGPFMEERKGSGGDSTKPLPRRDNDATYQLVLEKAKTSGELAYLIDLKDKAGATPLLEAITMGSIKNVQLLLNYGAPVNAYNQQRLQPMRQAVERFLNCKGDNDSRGLREMIVLLLDHGAPVHVVTDDANGDTAFHAIVRLFPPDWDLVNTFLEYGASVLKPNYLGEKARDISVVSKRLEGLLRDKSSE
eukprot:Em0115g8a